MSFNGENPTGTEVWMNLQEDAPLLRMPGLKLRSRADFSDEEGVGEFRSARERFLSAAPGSLDHDLYPMLRAAMLIRQPELREALLMGSARDVDEELKLEWGEGLFCSLTASWNLWAAAVVVLTNATSRAKNPVNKWDPLDPADGGPALASVLLWQQMRLHLRPLSSLSSLRPRLAYRKAEWVAAEKIPQGLLANMTVHSNQNPVPVLMTQKLDPWEARCSAGSNWFLATSSQDPNQTLGVAVTLEIRGPEKRFPIPSARKSFLVFSSGSGASVTREGALLERAALKRSASGFNPPGWDAAAQIQAALRALPKRSPATPIMNRGWREAALVHLRELP